MSKVICEICGTEYDSSAAECPICGWEQEAAAEPEETQEVPAEEILEDEEPETEVRDYEDDDFIIRPKKNRVIFDYDAVNTAEGTQYEEVVQPEYEDGEEEYEEEPRTNVGLVIFLVLLIAALLAGSAFIFLKFYLPGKKAETKETEIPTANAQIVETEPEETTVPTIPCTNLALPNGIDVLKSEGQYFLLHAVKMPEDTTDELTYASQDESVATVSADGRVQAVGEGETNIIVTCGNQQITCPVTVRYEEEVTEATESLNEILAAEEAAEEAAKESEAAEAAQAGETAPAEDTRDLNNVVLKLKKNDIQIGRQGVYVDLELDCDLKPEEVGWFSSNSDVVMVENGRVTARAPGLAKVTAKYGDQEVTCIVRCVFG